MIRKLLDAVKFENKHVNRLDFIDLEPTLGCNLRCKMCHVSFMPNKVAYLPIEQIDFEFARNKTVSIGAAFEPLIHPQANLLFEKLNEVNANILLVTNGHNLNKKSFPALFDSNLVATTFSFDGITEDTYASIRTGGNFGQTVNNIEKFVSDMRPQNVKFAVNMTVMKRNVNEVSVAPMFWSERGIDLLRFITMVVRENDQWMLENSLLSLQEQLSSALEGAMQNIISNKLPIAMSHPRLKEWYPHECPEGIFSVAGFEVPRQLQSMHHFFEFDRASPLPNGCNSPFRAVRIDHAGYVYLCHNKPVGNLLTQDFNEIWLSKISNKIRNTLIGDISECAACDYFNLCINSHHLDSFAPENFFSDDFKRRFPQEYASIITTDQTLFQRATTRESGNG